MYGLKNMLLQEKRYLEDIIAKAKDETENAPIGSLRVSRDGKRTRFYHCVNDTLGSYIPHTNAKLPKELAQKSYDYDVIKKAEKRVRQINNLVKDYADNEIEDIYNSLHLERRLLVEPIEPTIDQQIKKWYEQAYKGKTFQEGTAVILTNRGERVRSKSEKILADLFAKNNILYLYEKPLYLEGYGIVYPDFTFYSRRLREEIYWEHEGMLDKQEYARTAVKKLNSYQMNGIYPGERLILSFETEHDILNLEIINELIERYLLD